MSGGAQGQQGGGTTDQMVNLSLTICVIFVVLLVIWLVKPEYIQIPVFFIRKYAYEWNYFKNQTVAFISNNFKKEKNLIFSNFRIIHFIRKFNIFFCHSVSIKICS